MALLPSAEQGASRIMGGILGAMALTGGLWLIRQLYFRLSVHNAQLYEQLIEQQQQIWWKQHQHAFALSEWALLGPAGADISQWVRLLKREHRLPEVKNEANGKALRISRTLVDPADKREAQLAKMLVLQWQAQRADNVLPPIVRCYWQGSFSAWRVFRSQMGVTFPDAVLPDEANVWRGEETLSALASASRTLSSDEAILVAGCHSALASFNAVLPAGESAALWLVSQKGPVSLTRGEFYDSAGDEALTAVCERAQQQSELEDPPDYCLLFSQPELPALAQCGWNVTHHIQDLNWGNPGDMEMLTVLTLAAICASHHQEPCGWIAKDLQHTLALGIVKPYGQG